MTAKRHKDSHFYYLCNFNPKKDIMDKETKKKLKYLEITAPCCGRSSNAIKEYTLFYLENWFIVYRTGDTTFTACPSCARKVIWLHALRQTWRQNIFWPLFGLPIALIQTIKTYIPGHCKDICEDLYRSYQNHTDKNMYNKPF